MTAGYQKIFSPHLRIGFLAHAADLSARLTAGEVPAEKLAETQALIFNDRLDAVLTGLFMILVLVIVAESARQWYRMLSGRREAAVAEYATAD